MIESTVEVDMNVIDGFNTKESRQILAFLKHLSASAPYELNISKIASTLSLNRNKLIHYLNYLEQADLIYLINYPESKKSSMSKPDKVFLNNPNLYFALNPENYNIGTVREDFALNQLLQHTKSVKLHRSADFEVNGKYIFEIGGKCKNVKQIAGLEHGYILADNLETTYQNRIPIWLLGFLY